MKKIKIAIVDNEPNQIEEIKKFCESFSLENNFFIEINSFYNGYDFLEKDSTIFDCVFMDIDMPGINGMDVSNKLREKNKNISIVFITNLPQFAIDGYKVQALDFILKPISYADFSLVMNKILSITKKKEENLLFVIHNEMIRISSSNILYFEMNNHNVNIHLNDKSVYSYRETVKELELKLKNKSFYRCNSGIIVNLEWVKSIKNDVCILSDGTTLQVSRSRKNDFLKAMTDYYFETGI